MEAFVNHYDYVTAFITGDDKNRMSGYLSSAHCRSDTRHHLCSDRRATNNKHHRHEHQHSLPDRPDHHDSLRHGGGELRRGRGGGPQLLREIPSRQLVDLG